MLLFNLPILKINGQITRQNFGTARNFLSKFATAVSIIGALLVANQIAFGYWFFLAGSTSWLTVAIARKDKELMLTNAAFAVVNVWGLIAWQ